MKLRDLIQGFNVQVTGPGSALDLDITDITDDSRQATPGCLFVARPGTKADGRKFISDAVAKGAAAVLEEQGHGAGDAGQGVAPKSAGKHVALTTPSITNALVGQLAERFFDNPSAKLRLIGVTGTKGKTTITFVIQHLLHAAGIKTGIIGTVVNDDGDPVNPRTPAELTTPGAIDLSRLLARMVKNGCLSAVMEVSSHALHQGRAAALRFDVAVFTNLTGDHLDYHKTMDDYAAAKAILFESLAPEGWAVINADDPYAARMSRDCKGRLVLCGLKGQDATRSSNLAESKAGSTGESSPPSAAPRICTAEVFAREPAYTQARFDGPWGSVEVKLPLVGAHNVMNALEAVAAANCVTSLAKTLRSSLERCPAPPGRLERVNVESQEGLPTVLVDYAHTHDALYNVLTAMRPFTRGKLIAVFGCGGDRDRTKRPKMAAVCCKLADTVVITSDNPRTEDPLFILGQVLSGVPAELRPRGWKAIEVEELRGQGVVASGGQEKLNVNTSGASSHPAPSVYVEPDRAKAIELAINAAGPDDVVLIAGKGHEDYQIIGTTKRHFDDREEAARVLRQRGGSGVAMSSH